MRRIALINTRGISAAPTLLPTATQPVGLTRNAMLNTNTRFSGRWCASSVSFYKRLDVDSSATLEEIKAAYRHRALVCHPDVVDDSQKAWAEVEFRAVSEAYDVLTDPQKRAEHDKALGLNDVVSPKKKKKEEERGADASSSSSFHSTTTRPQKKKFVRGDADRKFREAFHGKSLDQVIFQERLRRRQMQHDQRSETVAKPSPAGHEESLRRVVADAAERFSAKVQRQYGPSMVRHVKLQTSFASGPKPPPSDYMPFRPFCGWSMPADVRTPPEPTLGRISHVNEEEGPVQLAAPARPERRELPKHFPVVKAMDGSVAMKHREAALHIERERHDPYNMGKLYSYHRPY